MPKIERVLISVTDKTGVAELARELAAFGAEIVSTGGTARLLREAGLTVRDISEVTGFPEMLDGRVKTIHPKIAGGVLAIRANAEHMQALAAHGIATIDMVVVNLYAFEKVAAREGADVGELIENIDIGGPTLIRASAKNYQDVAVVTSPSDYAAILEELKANAGSLSLATHWRLARKAFELTAGYDRAISSRLARIKVEEGQLVDTTDRPAESCTEDYVGDSFKIESTSVGVDDRKWQEIPEASRIPNLATAGKLAEAIAQARELQARMPDFYFSYYWIGYLHEEQGSYSQARAILQEGYRICRRKHDICDRLARTEYQVGNLPEAVKWWIRSMVIRQRTGSFQDPDPYLYLSYIAKAFRLNEASARLLARTREIRSVELNSATVSRLQNLVRGQGTQPMKTAIQLASERLLGETADETRQPPAPLPPTLDIRAPRALPLRYGENPHQQAALYSDRTHGIAGATQLHGKELSYNNLVDLDAAWNLVNEFSAPAAAIIKHTNPCGCAEQATLAEAYRKALECDPVSAYGGVLAFNRPLDDETAREAGKTFMECIAAPDYTPAALAFLTGKKNLRLLQVTNPARDELVVKSISGGFLAQTADVHALDRAQCVVRTERAPSEDEWQSLLFVWKVTKHVKSNAIVYARDGQTVAVGAGQMSRVDSVRIAAMKAALPLAGTVIGSDAFFPFADGVEEAAKHGATAVIQPGGSVRDDEVIAAANRLGLAMVFTGVRHFRH